MKKTHLFLFLLCFSWPGCFGDSGTSLPGGTPGQLPFAELERPDRASFPVDAKRQTTALSEATTPCAKLLASDKSTSEARDTCLAGLDKIAKASEPLAGGSFQFDQVLSELARLRDGIRILAWRIDDLHDPKLIVEQRSQVQSRLESLRKILLPLAAVERLDAVLEDSLHADAAGLTKRFLEADRREIGLLYEKMSRGVFDQGTLPQNVRIATIEHYSRVFKARLLLRALRLFEPEKVPPDNANKDANLEPIGTALASQWSAYSTKGLLFIDTCRTSARAQSQTELSAAAIASNKKAVSAAYLEWTEHHEGLLGK